MCLDWFHDGLSVVLVFRRRLRKTPTKVILQSPKKKRQVVVVMMMKTTMMTMLILMMTRTEVKVVRIRWLKMTMGGVLMMKTKKKSLIQGMKKFSKKQVSAKGLRQH